MTRVNKAALVIVGIALGCGASSVSPMLVSSAKPVAGSWRCYAIDRFPDVDEAVSWGTAVNITEGLNRVASHVPAGTVFTSAPLLCVKH